jgi:hypothetical protein
VWGVNKDIKVQVNKQKAQQCLSCPADVDYDNVTRPEKSCLVNNNNPAFSLLR